MTAKEHLDRAGQLLALADEALRVNPNAPADRIQALAQMVQAHIMLAGAQLEIKANAWLTDTQR